MSNTYKGINYAGVTGYAVNRNPESEIRFGIIHHAPEWFFDDAKGIYPDVEEPCPECGHVVILKDAYETLECSECEHRWEPENGVNFEENEPTSYVVNDGKIHAEFSPDWNHTTIFKSEFYTYGTFCSPCCPGAIDLDAPLDVEAMDLENIADNKAYCFGHDWFEDGIAPYPVFSVELNVRVIPVK